MRQGLFLLEEAENFKRAANVHLQNSNALRQKILALRRGNNSGEAVNPARINSLGAELDTMQMQGSMLRQQAQQRRKNSLVQFSRGLQLLYPDWVTTIDPLQAEFAHIDNDLPIRAHNTPVRSVHPGVPNESASAVSISADNTTMTLAVGSAPNQQNVDDVDNSSVQFSSKQLLLGHIETAAEPIDERQRIPINTLHQWHLLLTDLQGRPLENARIEFSGHMPGHVHGLPTQPQINREVAPGVYLVEGVKFQMSGWWVIDFDISHQDNQDTLRFNLLL